MALEINWNVVLIEECGANFQAVSSIGCIEVPSKLHHEI